MIRMHNRFSSHVAPRTALAALLLAAVTAPALAVSPTPFTPNNPISGAPVGFTYAGNKFVGTVLGNGTGLLYSTDLSGTIVSPFGGNVSLATGFGQEHYVAASLGVGGFPSYDLYVASGNNVQHINNAGTPQGNFISPSTPLTGLVRGIMFDSVGSFNKNMIVTTFDQPNNAGYVYTVTNAGAATQIAAFTGDVEGLDIAPLGPTWGTYAGFLFVAQEGAGLVSAISSLPAHPVTSVVSVASAEQLSFVPLNLGASLNPLEGLYSANYGIDVVHADYTQFTGMAGDIIVTGETTGKIWDIAPSASPTAVLVGNFPVVAGQMQPEDGLFVTADMLANAPEPASLTLLGLGAATMLMRRRRSMS